jgi:hypothetical protein
MKFTLDFLYSFGLSLLFTSSRLTSRHITSHRIILHHLSPSPIVSHRPAPPLLRTLIRYNTIIVRSTRIFRTHTVGLVIPGPFFGGQRCPLDPGIGKTRRFTPEPVFYKQEAPSWSVVDPLRLGRVSSNVRIRISGFDDRTGAASRSIRSDSQSWGGWRSSILFCPTWRSQAGERLRCFGVGYRNASTRMRIRSFFWPILHGHTPAFDLVDSTTSNLEGRCRSPKQFRDCEHGRRIPRASPTKQKPSALLAWSSSIPGFVCIFRPLFSIFPGCIDRLIPHHSTPSRHYAYIWTLQL